MTSTTATTKLFHIDPNELVLIGLDTKDDSAHPLYDKRVNLPVDDNLVKGMMVEGFRGAIEVRENGEKYEVVFGRQRVKAARAANKLLKKSNKELILVSCKVVVGEDADLFGVRVGENTRRRALKVMETSDELARYMAMGRSEDQAAIDFNMSKQNVKNMLKLQNLAADVKKAVERGDLTPSAAAPLASLEREEQLSELEKLLSDKKKGIKPTRAQAKKNVKKKAKKGDGEGSPVPKRIVNNVLKLNKKHGNVLPSDFVRGILWVLGDIGPNSIGGLAGLIKEVEELKGAKKAKKDDE